MDRPTRRSLVHGLKLLLIFTVSVGLFYLGWQYDNKYTDHRHEAQMGMTWLNAAVYEQHPFLYLVDGWAFYEGTHTPNELAVGKVMPTAYFYLGRYGGFDLGDASAPRHGSGTYRMTVHTGSNTPQEYALELTEIYSRWNLWINGELRQSVGMGLADAPTPASGIITFTATDKIEIVVAVESITGNLYSGMVYPPAFGSPEAVSRQMILRMVIHCAAAAVALLLGLLCLLVGAGLRFSRPYAGMFLLCVCFAVYTGWPLPQSLGFHGIGWSLAERLGYYAMLLLLIYLQGKLIGLSQRVYLTVSAGALAVCLLIFAQPFLPMEYAGSYYLFGSVLEGWKWLAATYLICASLWAVKRQQPGAQLLLWGFVVFAAALLADRLWPMYEPVYFGWPQEGAGFALIILIAAVLWQDTLRVYHDSLIAGQQKKLAEAELAANRRYTALQQEYVVQSERHLHETRNRYLMLRHYAEAGEGEKLIAALDRQLEGSELPKILYCGNALLDALLHPAFTRAASLGVYVEHRLTGIQPQLPIEDEDLASLVSNVLDNALCAAAEADAEKWLSFTLTYECGVLTLHCANAKGQTQTEQLPGHGYGLIIMRGIVEGYGGGLETEDLGGSFEIRIHLPLTGEQSDTDASASG